jgi:hypothetical protein
MAINLNELPDSNPSGPVPKGTYKARITKTSMEQPKDTSKPQYLKVVMNVTNQDGESYKFTDRFFESDSSYLLFKLKRFMQALDLNLQGSVELKDIEKLIEKDSELIVVITHQTSEYNGQEQTQAQVDLFNSDCYYDISSWDELTGNADDPFKSDDEEKDEGIDNKY